MYKKSNVFLDIEEGISAAEISLQDSRLSDENKRIANKRLRALKEVAEYVDSYEWCKGNKAKERVVELRKANFDYDLLKGKGYSNDAIKSFVWRSTKLLEEKIGEDTVDLIINSVDSYSDNISRALQTFRVLSGKFDFKKFLLNEVSEDLPSGERLSNVYDVSECLNELKFLYQYSKISLQFDKEDLDLDKLNTLVYAMTHKTERYSKFQGVAIQMFQGKNYDIDTVVQMIEDGDFD